jgi:hypothetical protein
VNDEFRAISSQVSRVGALAGLAVIVTIYMMTAKPF